MREGPGRAAGLFVVPVLLLALGHRLRRRRALGAGIGAALPERRPTRP